MVHEFVVDEVDIGVLAEKLGGVVEAVYQERRTWWDTFDWRLHGAGLLLEHQVRSDQGWLVLSEVGGRRLVRSRADGFDTESVPDRVAALVGIRRLLPRASCEGRVTLVAVLDDESKTVARIAVARPIVANGKDLGGRVAIEPLRGYDKDARRVARRLAGGSTADPLLDAVFEAHGVRPGDYRAKPDPLDDRSKPAGQAYAGLLGQLLDIVRANLDGTLRQHDTEFLHDLRVAVRRSRSLLKIAGGVLPDETRTKLGTELKWLGDATSASRDLDVYLLGFDAMISEPEALEPFRRLLTRHRRQAHTVLNRALRSARFRHLVELWAGDLAGDASATPVGEVADAQLRRAWRRVEKRGAAITVDSPAANLHDLRKRCKELRYLLEFFSGLYDRAAHRELVGELKQLQENLGEFQDSEAQRFLVRHHAEELAAGSTAAATLLAMGRLEEHLAHRQAAARDEFAARWTWFDRRHNQRLVMSLVGSE